MANRRIPAALATGRVAMLAAVVVAPLAGPRIVTQGEAQAVASPVPAFGSIADFKGADGPVFGLDWSPDGTTLAATGYQKVNLWRLGSSSPLRTFRAHTDLVRDVAWSPDGRTVASAGQDGTVRVWDALTLETTVTLSTGPARSVAWSPDGARVATGSEIGVLQVWRLSDGVQLHTARLQTTISRVSWSPDGRSLAVAGINGLTTIWDADRGELRVKLRASGTARNDANGLAWSPHGRVVATAHGARGAGGMLLWNAATGVLLQTLPSEHGWLRGVRWSADARWIAAAGEDGQVRIWDVESGHTLTALPTDSRPVWSLAWSRDGRRLAAGNTGTQGPAAGGTVSVWDVPERVHESPEIRDQARRIESLLLARHVDASTSPPPASVVKDGAAYGSIVRIEPPFGNLETSLREGDLKTLGIDVGMSLGFGCRDRSFGVALGRIWTDAARGEWVAYFSFEGHLVIAINGASAAEASQCSAGDAVLITRRGPAG